MLAGGGSQDPQSNLAIDFERFIQYRSEFLRGEANRNNRFTQAGLSKTDAQNISYVTRLFGATIIVVTRTTLTHGWSVLSKGTWSFGQMAIT